MEPKRISKYHLFGLSALSGILLSLSWPAVGISYLIFFAFIPLLFISDYIGRNKQLFAKSAIVLYTYPAFIIFNVWTTLWVKNSTLVGAMLAFLLNALFMALIFGLFHFINRKFKNKNASYLSLIFLWIAFEYLHMDWDLSWPWLTLGNVFATAHKVVQWYEFTGILGGSVLVLSVNILLYVAFKNFFFSKIKKISFYPLIVAVVLVAGLFSYSLITYNKYEEKGKEYEIVAIQPNVDPYTEQFSTPAKDAVENITDLAKEKVSKNTDCIIAPESALQEGIWESDIENKLSAILLRKFLDDYPKTSLIIGASTRRFLDENEEIGPAARKYPFNDTDYYYSYNTALHLVKDKNFEFYHKAKLVPGVEKMPFKSILKHIDQLAIDLGGTTGSLGKDKVQRSFKNPYSDAAYAPIICYESIYGEFVTRYIKNGANILTIITNDAWWGNTLGHKQHYEYARLRAIETRRSIARSANTGISGFFNQRGDDFKATKYEERTVIKHSLQANNEITFYVKYGDILGRISVFASAMLLLIAISVSLRKKGKRSY